MRSWRSSWQAAGGGGSSSALAAAAAAVLILMGLDAATGGSSHVTRAVGGGPGEIVEDLWRRLEISWDTATATWYAALVVATAARRAPRAHPPPGS